MNDNNGNLEDKLKHFFTQFTREKVTKTTSINNDLRLQVSEIPTIIDFLKKEFRVELRPEDLEPYFPEEFNIPFQYTFYKIFSPQKLIRDALTIEHMIKVCNSGLWFPPTKAS